MVWRKFIAIKVLNNDRGVGVILAAMICSVGMAIMFGILQSYITYRGSQFARMKTAYNMTFVLENLARYVYSGFDEANRKAYARFALGPCASPGQVQRVGPTGQVGCWPDGTNAIYVNQGNTNNNLCGQNVPGPGPNLQAVVIYSNPANPNSIVWGCFDDGEVCISDANSGDRSHCAPTGPGGPGNARRVLAAADILKKLNLDPENLSSSSYIADLQLKFFKTLDEWFDPATREYKHILPVAVAQPVITTAASATRIMTAIPTGGGVGGANPRLDQDCDNANYFRRCIQVSLCFSASGRIIMQDGLTDDGTEGFDPATGCYSVGLNLNPILEVRGSGVHTGDAICRKFPQSPFTTVGNLDRFSCRGTSAGACGGILSAGDRVYCQKITQ